MSSHCNVRALSVKPLNPDSVPQFVCTITDCSMPSDDMICVAENDPQKQVSL